VVLLTWIFAPVILHFYPSIGQNGVWLARALSLSLYIGVLRSISLIQLERTLDYKPIAWAESVSIFLYQLVAIVCAVGDPAGARGTSTHTATAAAAAMATGTIHRNPHDARAGAAPATSARTNDAAMA